jgi:hypothetical protein
MCKGIIEIKRGQPIYYNPVNHGLHVVFGRENDNIVVGDCCQYFDDAYTTIMRYVIPKEYLNKWKHIEEDKLSTYGFLETNKDGFIRVTKDKHGQELSDDMIRSAWYKTPEIVRYFNIPNPRKTEFMSFI